MRVGRSNFSATSGLRSVKTVGRGSCPIGKHLGLRDLSLRTKVAGARLLGVCGGFALPPPALGGFERDQDARADAHLARTQALFAKLKVEGLRNVVGDTEGSNRIRGCRCRRAPDWRSLGADGRSGFAGNSVLNTTVSSRTEATSVKRRMSFFAGKSVSRSFISAN